VLFYPTVKSKKKVPVCFIFYPTFYIGSGIQDKKKTFPFRHDNFLNPEPIKQKKSFALDKTNILFPFKCIISEFYKIFFIIYQSGSQSGQNLRIPLDLYPQHCLVPVKKFYGGGSANVAWLVKNVTVAHRSGTTCTKPTLKGQCHEIFYLWFFSIKQSHLGPWLTP
jgi:hypothetical protein